MRLCVIVRHDDDTGKGNGTESRSTACATTSNVVVCEAFCNHCERNAMRRHN
jgi:hypothetical protein